MLSRRTHVLRESFIPAMVWYKEATDSFFVWWEIFKTFGLYCVRVDLEVTFQLFCPVEKKFMNLQTRYYGYNLVDWNSGVIIDLYY